MREGWEIRKFEDCLQKVKSSKKIPKKSFLTEGVYPIVSQEKELINGYWNKSEDVLKVDKPIVIFGDHTKIVKHIDFDFVKGADGIVTLLPIKEINSKFFAYQLQNIELRDLGYARHYRLLKENDIVFPQLGEQKQIVVLLDKTFAAIDQAKANISTNIVNAKELFQSKLNAIFSQKGDGWEEKSLGKHCIISMGQSPKGTSYNSEGVGTPLINGPVEFGPDPFSKTIKSKWTTEPTKLCEEGDLILCVRGSTTGRINIAGFQACIGRGVASIRYMKNQEWINFFIRCNQKNIFNLGTGSTFPNVSGRILSELKFSEPKSIEVQNHIILTMKQLESNINDVINSYKKKHNDLKDLKKSILQKAFAGALTQKEMEKVF